MLLAHRRFGKDWVSILDLLKRIKAWSTEPHRKQLSPTISVGVVYPTHPLAGEFWLALKRMVPKTDVQRASDAHPRVMLMNNGTQIEVRTGSDPEMLVAAGYDLLILGEAARLPYDAYLQCLPMLASPGRGPNGAGGMVILQTTPKGQNWVAREMENGTWETMRIPIYTESGARHPLSNEHVTDAEVQQQRLSMPVRWFNQEWMASFLDSEGAVFRNVRESVAPAPKDPKEPLLCGVDLAKHSDYSVFVVFDSLGRMVEIERHNTISYPVQAQRLLSILSRNGVRRCVIESNGPGEPFFDNLLKDMHENRHLFNVPCELLPFNTNAQSKRQMIDSLVVAFERSQITILPDEELINEFEAYESSQTKVGNTTFSAPEGGYDDRVMACALAWTEIAAKQRSNAPGRFPTTKSLDPILLPSRFSSLGRVRGEGLRRDYRETQ